MKALVWKNLEVYMFGFTMKEEIKKTYTILELKKKL